MVVASFAVVAEERSFTKAALKLGVSRSASSHSIRTLEERLGLRLLARTTRSVAPTDAGERLLAQLRPALEGIASAITDVGRLRAKPAGTVRLVASPMAIAAIVWPRLAKFARDYPDVVLDISTEGDSRPDLVAERFDAGIHLGEFVERDMVAVKVSEGDLREPSVTAFRQRWVRRRDRPSPTPSGREGFQTCRTLIARGSGSGTRYDQRGSRLSREVRPHLPGGRVYGIPDT